MQLLNADTVFRGGHVRASIERTRTTFDIAAVEGDGGIGRLIADSASDLPGRVPVERLLFGTMRRSSRARARYEALRVAARPPATRQDHVRQRPEAAGMRPTPSAPEHEEIYHEEPAPAHASSP